MYEIPSLYDTVNYIIPVPKFALEELCSECRYLAYPCDKDVYDLCKILMIENNLVVSSDPYEITELYINLRRLLKAQIN